MRLFRTLLFLLLITSLTACSESRETRIGTFVSIASPAGDGATGPRFSRLDGGPLVLSWMERRETGGALRAAAFHNEAFSEVIEIAVDDRMFVNWADTPSVTHVSGTHWLAHWLRYSADETYSYDVVASQSFDNGTSWSEPWVVHNDGTPTEHGFVSIYRASAGIGLIWLDGRFTPDGPMTLRSAVVTTDGALQQEQELDENVCDCCQTDVAISSTGPLAVYRDRTPDQIRDIYIARHDGTRWIPGSRLYADDWQIAGCPVNGPSIAADGDFVAVAWFSAANDQPIVRVLLSTNGGDSFGKPIEVAAGSVAGYVGLDILDKGSVAVSWVARTASGNNAVMVRSVALDGALGPPVQAGETQQLRVFPQLAVSGDSIVAVWTDEPDGDRVMKAAVAHWSAP
ncbi:MAG: hypothetical protein QNJ14_13155 [Woeseiaceae bacterium]|nr:hypothetical protein [Woeseiaceae bacterium]